MEQQALDFSLISSRSARMKNLWADPEFRQKQKRGTKYRRAWGEAKKEKEERKRRRELKRAMKEQTKKQRQEQREQKERKRKIIEEYIEENNQKKSVNTGWMTCLVCQRLLPASKIVDKRFNICIDCKE